VSAPPAPLCLTIRAQTSPGITPASRRGASAAMLAAVRPTPTRTSGFFLQRSAGNRGHLDLLVPLADAPHGIAHHALDLGAEAPAWRWMETFGEGLGPVAEVSLIQSNFGDPGNLEAVARFGDRLAAIWRGSEPGASWSTAFFFAAGASGAPALIQGTHGQRGNFELVAPLVAGGLGHWYRDNDRATLAWHGPTVIGEQLGHFASVALIQSRSGDPGPLELVARLGDRLVFFWRGDDMAWRGPHDVVSGVAGRPALLQGRAGARGNFELLAPLSAAGVGHWYREDDDPAMPWRGPHIFATDLGRCDAAALLQAEASATAPARLEAVVLAGDRAAHLARPGDTWARRATFSIAPRPGAAAVAVPEPVAPAPEPVAPAPEPVAPAAPEPVAAAPAPPRPRRVPRPGASPLLAGPHRAGFRRIGDLPLSEDARYPDARPFEGSLYRSPDAGAALLYYPATADGEDAPLARGNPFPVLAVAHARRLRRHAGAGAPEDIAQDYRQLTAILAHLARRGFVVIAPDLGWLTPDDGPARRAAALRDALSYLRAGSRGPLLADFERAGLLGHGLGALAALTLATDRSCPFNIRSAALMAPTAEPLPSVAAWPPLLVLQGTADTGEAGAGQGPAVIYAAAGAPKHLVTLPGANHFGYTTSLELQEPFDGVAALPRREQQRAAKAYLAAFFEHTLRGDEDGLAWISGDAAVPGLEVVGVDVQADLQGPAAGARGGA